MRARKRNVERERKNAVKGRGALKLVTWNVNIFAQRAADLEALFAH